MKKDQQKSNEQLHQTDVSSSTDKIKKNFIEIKYLLYHEDYVDLNINQKIQQKAFYLKYSI